MTEKEKEKEENPLGVKLSPRLTELLAKLQEIELDDFEMEVGSLEISIQPGEVASRLVSPKLVPPARIKPQTIIQTEFIPPVKTYPGQIVEVKLGERRRKVEPAENASSSAAKLRRLSTLLRDSCLTLQS